MTNLVIKSVGEKPYKSITVNELKDGDVFIFKNNESLGYYMKTSPLKDSSAASNISLGHYAIELKSWAIYFL